MKILRSAILFLSMITSVLAASQHDGAGRDLEALVAEGERHAQAGELEAALRSYETAVAEAPHSSDIRFKLAGMQVLNGHYRDSIENFQRVISTDPENANAFVGMGIAYLHLGDYSLARVALQEASKRDEKKSEDIQQVLEWIETRIGQGAQTQDPQDASAE